MERGRIASYMYIVTDEPCFENHGAWIDRPGRDTATFNFSSWLLFFYLPFMITVELPSSVQVEDAEV